MITEVVRTINSIEKELEKLDEILKEINLLKEKQIDLKKDFVDEYEKISNLKSKMNTVQRISFNAARLSSTVKNEIDSCYFCNLSKKEEIGKKPSPIISPIELLLQGEIEN